MRCEHSPESLRKRRRPNKVHWGNRRHGRWHIMERHHRSSKGSHMRAGRRGAHELRSDGQRRGRRRCPPHVRPHAHCCWATVEATIKPASPAAPKPSVVRNSTTSWAARATVATAPPAAVVVVASLATPPAAAMVPAACAPLLLIPRGVVPTAAAAAGAPAPSRLVAAVVRPGAAVPGRVGLVRHGR